MSASRVIVSSGVAADTLVVDRDLSRSTGTSLGQPHDQRACTDVAVGILMRSTSEFLLTTRPPGKAYAGHWEFPGGKLEVGETVEMALARELEEELGIHVQHLQRWREQVVDYPHALVRLHFCKVTHWTGELVMREGQRFSWQCLPVTVSPLLAGTIPVLEWMSK